jgi:hypothetical protein
MKNIILILLIVIFSVNCYSQKISQYIRTSNYNGSSPPYLPDSALMDVSVYNYAGSYSTRATTILNFKNYVLGGIIDTAYLHTTGDTGWGNYRFKGTFINDNGNNHIYNQPILTYPNFCGSVLIDGSTWFVAGVTQKTNDTTAEITRKNGSNINSFSVHYGYISGQFTRPNGNANKLKFLKDSIKINMNNNLSTYWDTTGKATYLSPIQMGVDYDSCIISNLSDGMGGYGVMIGSKTWNTLNNANAHFVNGTATLASYTHDIHVSEDPSYPIGITGSTNIIGNLTVNNKVTILDTTKAPSLLIMNSTNYAGFIYNGSTKTIYTLPSASTNGVLTNTSGVLSWGSLLSIWYNTNGTRVSDQVFSFTGTYSDVARWNRSIFTCLGAVKTVTANAPSNYIKYGYPTRMKVGDMIWFTSGTLPTANPVLQTGRAYWVQAAPATGDSITISETPGGSVIDFTSNGANIKIRGVKIGYVSGITISGTTVSATVVTDTAMTSTDSLFRISQYRKMGDYSYSIYSGSVECVADASNPQGRRLLNFPTNAYLLSTDAALGTAATGVTAACAYNIYSGATALYTSAPDLTTNLTLTAQKPTTKFILSGSNITMRNTSVGGTVKPAYLQIDLYIVPALFFQNN